MNFDERSVDDRLRDIIEWGERATSYVEGLTFEAFVASTMIQDAVLRCIEVVGEAASRLLKADPAFEQSYPELELSAAYRTRNRLIHGYGSVNLGTVWETVSDPLPRLVRGARSVLRKRGAELP